MSKTPESLVDSIYTVLTTFDETRLLEHQVKTAYEFITNAVEHGLVDNLEPIQKLDTFLQDLQTQDPDSYKRLSTPLSPDHVSPFLFVSRVAWIRKLSREYGFFDEVIGNSIQEVHLRQPPLILFYRSGADYSQRGFPGKTIYSAADRKDVHDVAKRLPQISKETLSYWKGIGKPLVREFIKLREGEVVTDQGDIRSKMRMIVEDSYKTSGKPSDLIRRVLNSWKRNGLIRQESVAYWKKELLHKLTNSRMVLNKNTELQELFAFFQLDYDQVLRLSSGNELMLTIEAIIHSKIEPHISDYTWRSPEGKSIAFQGLLARSMSERGIQLWDVDELYGGVLVFSDQQDDQVVPSVLDLINHLGIESPIDRTQAIVFLHSASMGKARYYPSHGIACLGAGAPEDSDRAETYINLLSSYAHEVLGHGLNPRIFGLLAELLSMFAQRRVLRDLKDVIKSGELTHIFPDQTHAEGVIDKFIGVIDDYIVYNYVGTVRKKDVRDALMVDHNISRREQDNLGME